MTTTNIFRCFWIGLLCGYISACTGFGPTQSLFRSPSPHDQYSQSLKAAKLDQTALGSDWITAGERALHDSLKITVPYRESGYFPANKAFAVGYRLAAERGDRFLIKVETQGQKEAQVFIDVFGLNDRNQTTLVAASKADTNTLAWEPRKTQLYLIRVQPELLRSSHYTITISREPALAFPVQGRDSKQIASFFGAVRDGGRRRHEGVDIFAPRGTPALASVAGTITRVGTNKLGGNFAFLTDNNRAVRLYYAHLDRWNVAQGQRVSVGDTVGFVGNTGNARTIAPHLHFGLYSLGDTALNPLPFIRLGRGPAKQPMLPVARLGDSVRVSVAGSVVRVAPHSDAPIVRKLSTATALTIIGGTEFWLRVELADGITGYVASNTVEATKRPLQRMLLARPANLLDAANSEAAIIKTLPPGSTVDVLAYDTTFQLIRSTDGQKGWLSRNTTP